MLNTELQLCDKSKKEIHRFGESIKTKYTLDNNFSLAEFLMHLDGKLIYIDRQSYDKCDYSLIVKPNYSFDIFICNTYVSTRNFMIAKNIGHFYMHIPNDLRHVYAYPRSDKSLCSKFNWQACWFASGFLLTTQELYNTVKENKYTSIEHMANHLAISTSVISNKLRYLGLDKTVFFDASYKTKCDMLVNIMDELY